jgi:hypothetical protein
MNIRAFLLSKIAPALDSSRYEHYIFVIPLGEQRQTAQCLRFMNTTQNWSLFELSYQYKPQPLFRHLWLPVAALSLLGVQFLANGQSDNFNDGNDTSPPPAWIRYNPILTGSWSFPGGNTYRLQSAPSPDPVNYGQGRAGSLLPITYTNFYVAADVVNWDDTIHQVFGVVARIGSLGAGTTTGYLFSYDRGNPNSSTAGGMDIVRLDGEKPTTLPRTGVDSIHFNPGTSYRLEFVGIGTTLVGRVYELPDTLIPVLEITSTDTNYASGDSGVFVANNASESGYNGPADATFDNYLAAVGVPTLFANFNDGDDVNPPPAWQRIDSIGKGSWSFPNGNSYRIQSAPSPDPANLGQGRAASLKPGKFTNFYAAADIVGWDDTIHQVFGIAARITTPGLGTSSGYLLTYDRGTSPTDGNMDIVRVDGEKPTTLSHVGSDSIHLQPGTNYRFAFIGDGNNLTGQVYQLPDMSNPVVTISATDVNYGNGSCGLIVANNASETGYNGPADATFDNFLNTTAEPRLSTSLSGGMVTVTWPDIPYRFQKNPDLSPGSWTTVTSGIVLGGGQNTYTIPAASAEYYRLVYP